MEGGQKVQIPLDSSLDIKSNNMLSSLQAPTLLHNRQRFQGQYLPSSLRFEHNGWAAGNYVHEFPIENGYVVDGWSGSFNNGIYSFRRDGVVRTTKKIDRPSVNKGTLTQDGFRYEDADVKITDTVSVNRPWTEEHTVNNERWDIKLTNENKKFNESFEGIKNGEPIEVNGVVIPYDGYENGKHKWGEFETADGNITIPIDYKTTVQFSASGLPYTTSPINIGSVKMNTATTNSWEKVEAYSTGSGIAVKVPVWVGGKVKVNTSSSAFNPRDYQGSESSPLHMQYREVDGKYYFYDIAKGEYLSTPFIDLDLWEHNKRLNASGASLDFAGWHIYGEASQAYGFVFDLRAGSFRVQITCDENNRVTKTITPTNSPLYTYNGNDVIAVCIVGGLQAKITKKTARIDLKGEILDSFSVLTSALDPSYYDVSNMFSIGLSDARFDNMSSIKFTGSLISKNGTGLFVANDSEETRNLPICPPNMMYGNLDAGGTRLIYTRLSTDASLYADKFMFQAEANITVRYDIDTLYMMYTNMDMLYFDVTNIEQTFFGYTSSGRTVTLKNGAKFDVGWDDVKGKLVPFTANVIVEGQNITVTDKQVSFSTTVHVKGNGATAPGLEQYKDGTVKFGDVTFSFISSTGTYKGYEAVSVLSGTTLYMSSDGSVLITYIKPGLYGDKEIYEDGTDVVVEGTRFNIQKLLDSPDRMRFRTVNVNTGEESDIMEVFSNNEYQLVRQHWDTTVESEDFWYIDSETTAKLGRDFIYLYRKTDRLHDWFGDEWEEINKIPRYDVITSAVKKYVMASGYNTEPRLITIETPSVSTVRINVWDLKSVTKQTYDIAVENRSLGSNLIDRSKITTYKPAISYEIVNRAKLSATCRNGKTIIGMAVGSGLSQWAIVIDNRVTVYTGYGNVGIDGALTGGEFPMSMVDNGGVYSSYKVEPLDKLAAYKNTLVGMLSNLTVGNESQQWYISMKTPSICSHILFNGSTFIPVELQLNNNYAAIYGSPSSVGAMYGDTLGHASYIGDLIPEASATFGSAVAAIANMITMGAGYFYMWDPKRVTLSYLQQTVGQYAYVWRNNSNVVQRKDFRASDPSKYRPMENVGKEFEPELDPQYAAGADEITFDEQRYSQTSSGFKFDVSAIGNILFMLAAISAIEVLPGELQVNKFINQTAFQDFGKTYSQSFLRNAGALLSTDLIVRGNNPIVKSEVTAVKTLDMFYSTSDSAKTYAGKGYVNHNLVAQCVAQSVTDVHFEAQRFAVCLVLKIGSAVSRQIATGIKTVAEDLINSGSGLVSTWAEVLGTGGNVGAIPGIIMMGVGIGLNVGAAIVLAGCDILDALVDTMKPNPSAGVTDTGSKHAIDIEPKHCYGNKHFYGFWPCWDADNIEYTDESVDAELNVFKWRISMDPGSKGRINGLSNLVSKVNDVVMNVVNPEYTFNVMANMFTGELKYLTAMCKGHTRKVKAPEGMAVVEGVESFLSPVAFRSENLGVSEPIFTQPAIQDYAIDKRWDLSVTGISGETLWVAIKDTKIIDGDWSNVVISDDFLGIGCPYMAMEVKRGLSKEYLRPYAITPNALALNCTGYNSVFENKAYHSFDGIGRRIVQWRGKPGLDKEILCYNYQFQPNDRFKRSNILAPQHFLGDFHSAPVVSIDVNDPVYNEYVVPSNNINEVNDIPGEMRDLTRYAVPVFVEPIATLPAGVKTLKSYQLHSAEGITGLCTDLRSTQGKYKEPTSYDFMIGTKRYRATNEYICSVDSKPNGIVVTMPAVATIGMVYIGSTPSSAYFYSVATRQVYVFDGGTQLQRLGTVDRFSNILRGRWDFVNHELVMDTLLSFHNLDKGVIDEDDDLVDNLLLPRFNDEFVGDLWPPTYPVMNTRSWFRMLSLPCGFTYQGPNRCVVNRLVISDYMVKGIRENKDKWRKVPKQSYHPFRQYPDIYESVDKDIVEGVKGWTHNPFLFVTSPVGISNETDCMFEWEITFAWTREMGFIYKDHGEYMTVILMAETFTPGGKVTCEPTHIYLTPELFFRQGNVSYYSFRFQSKNGAGNRERLHIWSDAYIAISGVQCEVKPVTEKRNEILVIQEDVRRLEEF